MSEEEIKAMSAGREMDALIAEKIMGCINISKYRDLWTHGEKEYRQVVEHYSTNISDAWKVIEYLRTKMYWVGITSPLDGRSNDWICEWTTIDTAIDFVAAETAPLAICRAALLAVVPVTEGGV